MLRLVGSATPNVVPAGATVKVTFLFPAKGTDGWIYREPATGRRGIVGRRGPDRHPRQDPDHSGGRWGLVEPVAEQNAETSRLSTPHKCYNLLAREHRVTFEGISDTQDRGLATEDQRQGLRARTHWR